MLLDPYRFGAAAGPGEEVWLTTVDLAPNNSSSGWGGYTMRILVPAASLAAGSRIRLTLRASGGCVVEAAAIQLRATPGAFWDFAAPPIALTFGGMPGVALGANADAVTDAIDLPISGTRDLILAFYFSSGSIVRTDGVSGWWKWERAGNDVVSVGASGYSSNVSDAAYFVTKIEVLPP